MRRSPFPTITTLRRSLWTIGPEEPDGSASLQRSLAVALLLHVLVIAIVGTSPGGNVRLEYGRSGPLSVTLRGVERDATRSSALEVQPLPRDASRLPEAGPTLPEPAAAAPTPAPRPAASPRPEPSFHRHPSLR